MSREIEIFQVDAFADRVFGGNPAAVCPLTEGWLPDETMQSIAAENNLSETAFLVAEDGGYAIRWFTPVREVDLCGHATLASGYVILTHIDPSVREVRFSSRSGRLEIRREDEWLRLDLPALPPQRLEAWPGVADALGVEPREVWRNGKMLALLGDRTPCRTPARTWAKWPLCRRTASSSPPPVTTATSCRGTSPPPPAYRKIR